LREHGSLGEIIPAVTNMHRAVDVAEPDTDASITDRRADLPVELSAMIIVIEEAALVPDLPRNCDRSMGDVEIGAGGQIYIIRFGAGLAPGRRLRRDIAEADVRFERAGIIGHHRRSFRIVQRAVTRVGIISDRKVQAGLAALPCEAAGNIELDT